MAVKCGRVVLTPGAEQPYKVVLDHEDSEQTEHPVGSVREGEALIRGRAAVPPIPDRLREWNPLV